MHDSSGYDDGYERDPEGPSEADLERFGAEYVTCPHCGEEVYDQAEVCEHCLMALHVKPKSKGVWVTIGAIALVALFLMIIL